MYRMEIIWKSSGELQVVWCHSNNELIDYIRRADSDNYLVFKIERNGLED